MWYPALFNSASPLKYSLARLCTGEAEARAGSSATPHLCFRDHPLLTLKNIILTPHIGSATHQARRQMMEDLVESMLAALRGLAIPNEVLPPLSHA